MRKLMLIALGAGLLAGCRDRGDTITARTDFCRQLDEYRAALADVPPVEPTTEVSTMRKAIERVRREHRDLERDAERLDKARARELKRAQENWDRSVRQMPGSATLGEAAMRMRGPTAELRAASEQMSAAVQCPSGPTGQH
jgi:hypothetical protein